MAKGGTASDDTGGLGRDQAVQAYKALGLYPKSEGEPLKCFKQKGIRDRIIVVTLTLTAPWRGHGDSRRICPL